MDTPYQPLASPCAHVDTQSIHMCAHTLVKYCLFWLISEETSNLRFAFKVTMGPWFRNITYDLDAAEGLTRTPLGAKKWAVRERHQSGMVGTHLTTGILPCGSQGPKKAAAPGSLVSTVN